MTVWGWVLVGVAFAVVFLAVTGVLLAVLPGVPEDEQ